MVKCINCPKHINKKNPGLQCSKCGKWLHASCASISIDQLTALSATEAVDWKCKACVGSQKPKRLSYIIPDPDEDDGETSEAEGSITAASGRTMGNKMLQPVLQQLRTEIRNIIREELQQTLKYYSDKIDEYSVKINNYETHVKTLEKQCIDLKSNLKNINLKCSVLESKINQLEQNQLMCQIEICGVKESANEDPVNIAKQVATKMQVSQNYIIKAYRKRKNRTEPSNRIEHSPIIVTLQDGARDIWLNKAKDFKMTATELGLQGSDKVYLRESLAPGIAFLLWKTKEALKNTFKFIWCKNGTILLRKEEKAKIISIRTLFELESVMASQNKPIN
ncbi:unnamed protein product [Parnassius mnemosyne]|uniref:PHD-type domain-containing protein n=1 Tax=Parnassius mnemosyne TaxID=213953 RepID=A0AAV1KGC1_9NEOP